MCAMWTPLCSQQLHAMCAATHLISSSHRLQGELVSLLFRNYCICVFFSRAISSSESLTGNFCSVFISSVSAPCALFARRIVDGIWRCADDIHLLSARVRHFVRFIYFPSLRSFGVLHTFPMFFFLDSFDPLIALFSA